jgi:hypothetical protein
MEDVEKGKSKKNQINIELKEDVAQGTYSNLAIITHSSSELTAVRPRFLLYQAP